MRVRRPDAAPVSRRHFLGTLGVLAGGALLPRALPASPLAPRPVVTVYKDPGCGCCSEWVTHLRQNGFTVTAHDTTDMASIKAAFGIPEALASCHTARVGRYVIEGHVPAELIARLLAEQPRTARGLAVPGMPNRSPGMQQPGPQPPYDVLLLEQAGTTRVYATR